ncbi:hypothetical protein BVX95_02430, partial [archaeon D22]
MSDSDDLQELLQKKIFNILRRINANIDNHVLRIHLSELEKGIHEFIGSIGESNNQALKALLAELRTQVNTLISDSHTYQLHEHFDSYAKDFSAKGLVPTLLCIYTLSHDNSEIIELDSKTRTLDLRSRENFLKKYQPILQSIKSRGIDSFELLEQQLNLIAGFKESHFSNLLKNQSFQKLLNRLETYSSLISLINRRFVVNSFSLDKNAINSYIKSNFSKIHTIIIEDISSADQKKWTKLLSNFDEGKADVLNTYKYLLILNLHSIKYYFTSFIATSKQVPDLDKIEEYFTKCDEELRKGNFKEVHRITYKLKSKEKIPTSSSYFLPRFATQLALGVMMIGCLISAANANAITPHTGNAETTKEISAYPSKNHQKLIEFMRSQGINIPGLEALIFHTEKISDTKMNFCLDMIDLNVTDIEAYELILETELQNEKNKKFFPEIFKRYNSKKLEVIKKYLNCKSKITDDQNRAIVIGGYTGEYVDLILKSQILEDIATLLVKLGCEQEYFTEQNLRDLFRLLLNYQGDLLKSKFVLIEKMLLLRVTNIKYYQKVLSSDLDFSLLTIYNILEARNPIINLNGKKAENIWLFDQLLNKEKDLTSFDHYKIGRIVRTNKKDRVKIIAKIIDDLDIEHEEQEKEFLLSSEHKIALVYFERYLKADNEVYQQFLKSSDPIKYAVRIVVPNNNTNLTLIDNREKFENGLLSLLRDLAETENTNNALYQFVLQLPQDVKFYQAKKILPWLELNIINPNEALDIIKNWNDKLDIILIATNQNLLSREVYELIANNSLDNDQMEALRLSKDNSELDVNRFREIYSNTYRLNMYFAKKIRETTNNDELAQKFLDYPLFSQYQIDSIKYLIDEKVNRVYFYDLVLEFPHKNLKSILQILNEKEFSKELIEFIISSDVSDRCDFIYKLMLDRNITDIARYRMIQDHHYYFRDGFRDFIFSASVELVQNFQKKGFTSFEAYRLTQLGYTPNDFDSSGKQKLRESNKPNCLFVYPLSDHNGAFEDYEEALTFFQGIKNNYDVNILFAETESQVYDKLYELRNDNIELFVLSGHGTAKSISLGEEDLRVANAIKGEEYIVNTADTEFLKFLNYLSPKASIFLN